MSSELPLYTQACEDRDFVDWHRGCPWCAVWMVRVDVPAMQAAVQQARFALQPWLLPRYERQPHITLAFRGLMDGDDGHPAAQFGLQQLQRDVAALQALQQDAWKVGVQGGASFATVPYLSVVQGAAALQRLHAALTLAPSDAAGWQYVPHVTVGHYAASVPMAAVVQQLQRSVQVLPVLQVPVQQLWLARYQPQDIAGPLFWEGVFDLSTGCYGAQPGAVLGAV